MRVRTGKVIRATSLLGQANVPNVLTSSNKNFIPAINSTTKNFYLGGGINVGYSFNIISSHKYFMALRIKDITSTNVDYRRFALWDKTNNAYLNYPSTTLVDNDIFIAKYDSSISTEVYNTFQCHYTVDGVTGTPCWWIFIDLTALGLDTLTAQQFYNKYKNYLELLATGEEIVIDRGSGKVMTEDSNDNIVSCNVTEKMYGYNQSIQENSFDLGWAWNNATCSINTDRTIATVTCNTDGVTRITGIIGEQTTNGSVSRIIGHKYFSRVFLNNSNATAYYGKYGTQDITNTSLTSGENILEGIHEATAVSIYFQVDLRGTFMTGDTFTFYKYNIIDLTDWYGPGKEPTTVAEFKEKFSKDYYGFCPNKIMLTQGMINALPVYGYNQLVNPTQTIGYALSNPGNNNFNKTEDTNQVITLTKKTESWTGDKMSSVFTYLFTNLSNTDLADSKLMIIYKIKNCASVPFILNHEYDNVTTYDHSPAIPAENTVYYYELVDQTKCYTGVTFDNSFTLNVGQELLKLYLKECCVINLTTWYGAGSEPTTVEQFKATFPHKYYRYMKKSLLNRYMINELIS